MPMFAKDRHHDINWPVTGGKSGDDRGPDDVHDIDFERVVYDPEYRKRVLRRLDGRRDQVAKADKGG